MFGDRLLLKGGTLLSKVDLGFRRMSGDADLVLPRAPSRQKRANVLALNEVRAALRTVVERVGLRLPFPDGTHHDGGTHRQWNLVYDSEFGSQSIQLEVSLRPALRPARRVQLQQLLHDPLAGVHAEAFCFALDAAEARAEKVRAAFTREAIRDFYDLAQLAAAGADFSSREFAALVDAKLAELGAPPLARQPASFGLANGLRRAALEASRLRELPAVLRAGEPTFDLDAALAHFDRLWNALRP